MGNGALKLPMTADVCGLMHASYCKSRMLLPIHLC